MKKFIPLVATFLLFSCGGNTGGNTPSASTDQGTTTQPSVSYKEIDDVTFIDSGLYLNGKYVYELNKDDKKIINYDFNSEYEKLKAKDGTKVFEVSIKYIEYGDNGQAITFKEGEKVHYIYKNSTTNAILDESIVTGSVYSHTTVTLSTIPTFIEPTYGSYVSEELEQAKVDDKGDRMYNSDGSSIKEKFYLFLELSQTSAQIFVSDNNQSHGETPLHAIENYVTSYNNSGLSIKIPHKDGQFNCSLTITSASSIKFNNSFEKHGDYSAAGTFNLITK